MLRLRHDTDPAWTDAVLADLNAFLSDHAHNERKVVGSALGLAGHHPLRSELVQAMTELASEELQHFGQVHALLLARGATLGFDQPDPYAGPLNKLMRRRDVNDYLLDRLLIFAVVEARGCERFKMLADALPPGELKDFYAELFRCEARHHSLFTGLAQAYFDRATVMARLDEILEAEGAIVAALPFRAALH